jgi:hypothetical protein
MSTTDFFNVSTIAARYKVHPKLIYKEIEEGRLPAVKIGAPGSKRPTIRIPAAALAAWEAAQLGGAK